MFVELKTFEDNVTFFEDITFVDFIIYDECTVFVASSHFVQLKLPSASKTISSSSSLSTNPLE